MIAAIDSGICNLSSVLTALHRIGVDCAVTRDPAEVAASAALILPGVGAFGDGMESLRRYGLIEAIREHAGAAKPLLGICLGMQMLADSSEEFGEHEGLGLIRARARRLPSTPGLRVPNIGWCDVEIAPHARLFASVESGSSFYFVHSYHLDCADSETVVGWLEFGTARPAAAVEQGTIFGAQFHPEKSQDVGLRVLANFVRIASEGMR